RGGAGEAGAGRGGRDLDWGRMLYLLVEWLGESGAGWAYSFPLSLLFEREFRALLAVFLSFLLVVSMGGRVIGLLRRMGAEDTGQSDVEDLRQHAASKARTPTAGGVLICGGGLIVTLLLADISHVLVVLGVVVMVWLAGVGAADDFLKLTAARRGGGRQGLHAWEKLVFQLGIGLLAGWLGYMAADTAAATDMGHVLNVPGQRTFVPGGGGVEEGLVYLPRLVFIAVAVLFIAGMSNAVNVTDGMDGLAGGISAVVLFAVMVLALVAGRPDWAQYLLVPSIDGAGELAIIAASLGGACVGFLWFNCAPAQVFMGDTGSLSLGGIIAYLAIAIRQEVVVLIMCGVFIAEIASVVLQVGYFKATKGRRIFRCAPFHHHLQMGGWPESRVVGRLWLVTILLVVFALATLKVR
ncbi:MAG: phospho-N-acetylmuramoyl-pentapeptide-transferase, partial [Planctomycetota bacterium]